MKYLSTPRHLLIAVLCTLTLTSIVWGCLWDSDTLRTEAKGLPQLPDIITGRFERNPDLYYEMRLDRVTKNLAANKASLEDYDDAAVACDRLARSDEAIKWMHEKKEVIDRLEDKSQERDTHLYRYYANLGTIYVHRWLRHGADRNNLSDMNLGRDLIEKAIKLNPDAHFGRERYQLMAMNWIINPPEAYRYDDEIRGLPSIFANKSFWDAGHDTTPWPERVLIENGYADAAEGLSGLISLGNAWESVDIYYALSLALTDLGHASLAQIAKLRCAELIDSGNKSLHPESPEGEELKELLNLDYGFVIEKRPLIEYFQKARKSADQWHKARNDFMLAKLKKDHHPDTHEDFWAGYEPIKAVSLPNGILGFHKHKAIPFITILSIAILISILIIGLMRWYSRLRKARLGVSITN